jgi:NADH-quinone oxidoreductase subunit H
VGDIGRAIRHGLYGFGIQGLLLDFVMVFIAVFVVANFTLLNAGVLSVVLRRQIAFVQDRYGPNRVGPQGSLQWVADAIKMIVKEAIIPRRADRLVFLAAPVIATFPFVMAYLVIPWGSNAILADVNVGVLYLFAITSLAFPSLFMAGWASNNKYSMYGGMRAVAQLLAFEVPLTLSALGVVILTGSLSLQHVVGAQTHLWFLFPQLLGAAVFLVAGMAENAIHPFDLTEAESELVTGYFTEYSGMMFGLFLAVETGTMWTLSAIFTTFFLGGWQPVFLGFVPGVLWFLVKSYLVFAVIAMIRFSVPRFRIDQFLAFGWKVLTPLAFINLFIAAGESLVVGKVFQP